MSVLSGERYNEIIEKFASEAIDEATEVMASEEELLAAYQDASDVMDAVIPLIKEAEAYFEAAEEVQKEAEENYNAGLELADDAQTRANACITVINGIDEDYLSDDYLYSEAADEDLVDLVEKTAAVYKSAEEDYSSACEIVKEAEEDYFDAEEYKEAATAQYIEACEYLDAAEKVAAAVEEVYGIYDDDGEENTAASFNDLKGAFNRERTILKNSDGMSKGLKGVHKKEVWNAVKQMPGALIKEHPVAAGIAGAGTLAAGAGATALAIRNKKKKAQAAQQEVTAFDIIEQAYQEKMAAIDTDYVSEDEHVNNVKSYGGLVSSLFSAPGAAIKGGLQSGSNAAIEGAVGSALGGLGGGVAGGLAGGLGGTGLGAGIGALAGKITGTGAKEGAARGAGLGATIGSQVGATGGAVYGSSKYGKKGLESGARKDYRNAKAKSDREKEKQRAMIAELKNSGVSFNTVLPR